MIPKRISTFMTRYRRPESFRFGLKYSAISFRSCRKPVSKAEPPRNVQSPAAIGSLKSVSRAEINKIDSRSTHQTISRRCELSCSIILILPDSGTALPWTKKTYQKQGQAVYFTQNLFLFKYYSHLSTKCFSDSDSERNLPRTRSCFRAILLSKSITRIIGLPE